MTELLHVLLRDYLGVALALVPVLLAAVLWAIIRLARSGRAALGLDRAELAPEGTEVVIDLTLPPPRPDLRRAFARARADLRRAFPGHGTASLWPWVLVLGPPLAGKTTLLGNSRMRMPFGQPRQRSAPDHPGIYWWALEGGVALDVAGEDLMRLDGLSSDAAEWKRILEQIRRNRRRRPIDGIVLTLPAHAFIDEKKPLAHRLAEASRRGTLLHRKLGEAQRTLGMQVPVHLVVSHCDLIPGFGELLTPADAPAERRQQMFGWSNPASPQAPYSGGWIDQAFDRVLAEVDGFQLRALAQGSRPPSADAVLFPNRLAALREPLRIYANHLFSLDANGEPPIFRGLYFCGGGTEAEPAAGPGGLGGVEMPSEVAFVSDLMNRKVFPEKGIARPTKRAAARARIWHGALAGLALVALLWTAWGIWRGSARTRAAAAAAEPFLGAVASGLEVSMPAADDTAGPTAEARRLLAAASATPTFRLRSAALPASWLSALPRRMDRATETGFLRLVFAPSRTVLEQWTEQLIASPPPEVPDNGPVSTIYSIEGHPEFQALDRLTQDLHRLDRAIGSYQRFARGGSVPAATAVEEFNQLATATLGDQLRPRGRGPERYLGRRLSGIGATPFDRQSRKHSQRLETKVVARAGQFYDALFADNPLTHDLDAVLADWIDGGAVRRPRPSEVEQYRALLAALERAQRDISLPELQWTAADTLDLGPRFDEILRRVHVSPFLGPAVSDGLMRDAVARFARLKDSLGIYSTSDTGALLVREEETWALSPRLQAILDGLGALLGESFMQARCTSPPMDRSPTGRNLFWKSKPLEEALGLWTAYQGWGGSSELPPPLRDASPEVAAEAVAANIVCLVAEAQTLAYPPADDQPDVVEENIKLQIQNLQAVETTLQDLLVALGRLGLGSEQARLAQTLRDQRIHILGQLDNLLESLLLYEPRGGGFGWWQGEPAPGLEAFGVASADELDAYLETQRQIAARLSSEYAQPVLAMLGSSSQLALLKPGPPASKWQRIIAAVGAYGDKQAGNPLARLEGLITAIAADEPPDGFDLYSCFDEGMPAAGAAGGDFFLGRRQKLRAALAERCGQLADEKGHAVYVQLARIFNQRLWGSFPFAPPDANADATPDDLRAFYDAGFGNALILIDNLPARSTRFGDKKEAVQEFMRRMEDVRVFFKPFLAPEAKAPSPIYDLAVRFRIDRTREQGANQIISWLMSVGEPAEEGKKSLAGERVLDLLTTGSVSPAAAATKPPEPDARWLYGRPVTLAFRWASGSPFSPSPPAATTDPARATVEGRTLIYKYREPWSLLRLLTEHKAPSEESPDLIDPRPETVKLSIDTVSEDRPEPRTVADIYLRITLLSPDENEELRLPDFPTLEAPLTGPVMNAK